MNDPVLQQRVERFLGVLNQCQALRLKVVEANPDALTIELPWQPALVGNPATGVIHGGAITTLMDTTCGSVLLCTLPEFEVCPTLDLRMDYMRPATKGESVYARAEIYRTTRNVIFTRCEAYHADGTTVAHCVANFMRMGPAAVPENFRSAILGDAS